MPPAPENKPADAKDADAAARQKIILAYNDAKTREEKAALVKLHPFLAAIYSEGNHS